jgi:hypothetical protein
MEGDVWVDSDAVAGVLNQNDYLLKADAEAPSGYLLKTDAASGYATKAEGVRRYASAAARATDIPSPTAGMITYLDDTGTESPTSTIAQLQAYTGASWQEPYGCTLLANVTVGTTTSLFVNNVFSAAYDNYLIVWRLGAAGGSALQMRLTSGGTELIGTGYNWQRLAALGTSVSGAAGSSAAAWDIGAVRPTTPIPSYGTLNISNPFQSTQMTTYNHMYCDQLAAASIEINTGYNTSTLSYDGFRWFAGTGFNGTIKIYGYRGA